MKDKKITPTTDESLFRTEVGDVISIKYDGTLDTPKLPEAKRIQHKAQAEPTKSYASDLNTDILEMKYLRPGLQKKVLSKLKRGHFTIEAEIDLHSMRSERAEKELYAFIDECLDRNIRCARIIHGKGNNSENNIPVLKYLCFHVLRRHENVQAYISSHPKHGGHGALLVLMK
ncbi:MAG: Smr/MutS family protein [bacterium]